MDILNEYLSLLTESNNLYNSANNSKDEIRKELKKHVDINKVESKIRSINLDRNPEKEVNKLISDTTRELNNVSDSKLVKSILLLLVSYIIIGLTQLALHKLFHGAISGKSLDYIVTILTHLFTSSIIEKIMEEISKEGKMELSSKIVGSTGMVSLLLPKVLMHKSSFPGPILVLITFILSKLVKRLMGDSYDKTIEPLKSKIKEVILKIYKLVFSIPIFRMLPQ